MRNHPIFCTFIFFVFGTIMGSFLYCLSMRLCRKETFIISRSHCERCGHYLQAIDLIPLFSYLFQKGRCRYCGTKISIMYPVSELITGLLYALIYHKYGLNIYCALQLALWSVSLIVVFTDLDQCLIYNHTLVPGTILSTINAFIQPNAQERTLRCILTDSIIVLMMWLFIRLLEKIKKKEMMGRGDLKLYFMLGLSCDFNGQMTAIFISCIIGILFGLFWSQKKKEKMFPFAPSIVIAYFLTAYFTG